MRPWEAGKSFDHSAPCGPITPRRRVPATNGHGELVLTVNGDARQQNVA